MSEEFKIRFHCLENGAQIEAVALKGEFLNQTAQRAGVVIQQTCGGVPSCTDCRVRVCEGMDSIFSAPEGPEIRLMGNVYFITHERLACQAKVTGNGSVEVPDPASYRKKALNKGPSKART